MEQKGVRYVQKILGICTFRHDCISHQISLYTYGFINVIPPIFIICRISQFTNEKLKAKSYREIECQACVLR